MSDPYYPSYHKNDLWEVPEPFFNNGATLGTIKAAKFLGMSHTTLIKHADAFGLTVLRRQAGCQSWRYFLVSELEQLKRIMSNVSKQDIIKAGGMKSEISILKDFAKKKRSKAEDPGKNGRG